MEEKIKPADIEYDYDELKRLKSRLEKCELDLKMCRKTKSFTEKLQTAGAMGSITGVFLTIVGFVFAGIGISNIHEASILLSETGANNNFLLGSYLPIMLFFILSILSFSMGFYMLYINIRGVEK